MVIITEKVRKAILKLADLRDQMKGDEEYVKARRTVRTAESRLHRAQQKLAVIEKKYVESKQYENARAKVIEFALSVAESFETPNIEVSFTKGRVTTSWKSVAEALDPSEELIAKHTKVGDPKVALGFKD